MALIDLQFQDDDEDVQASSPDTPIELQFEGQAEGEPPPQAGVTGEMRPAPYSNYEKMTERLGQRFKKSAAGLKAMAAAQELPTTQEEMAEGVTPPTDGGVKDWLMYSPHGEMLNKISSMVTKGVVDVADMVHRGDLREDLQEANKVVREEANATLGAPYMQYEGSAGVKFGWDVAEATANMVPALAVGWATRNPGLTLGVITGQVAGDTYTDYLEKTGSHDKAMAAAKFHAAAEVIPETVPVLAILRKAKAGEGWNRFLEATIGEGAQEVLTSVLQQSYDNVALENMSLKEAILGIDWSDAAYEGAIGTVVGGILSTPGAAADYYAAKRQRGAPDPLQPDFEVHSLEENETAIDDALQATPAGPEFEPGDLAPAPEVDETGRIKREPALTEEEQRAAELRQQFEQQEPDLSEEELTAEQEANAFVLEQLRQQFPNAPESELLAAVEAFKPKREDLPTTEDLGYTEQPEGETKDQPEKKQWEPVDEDVRQGMPSIDELPPGVARPPIQPKTELPEADEEPTAQPPEERATEPVEPTGWASATATEFATKRPEFDGLIVSYKPGDDRHGTTMPHYYGEIDGTEDADGMPVDVLLNKDYNADQETPVFVVNQVDFESGEFRQHKVMAGFDSAEAAEKGYVDTWDVEGFGDIYQLTPEQFQDWIDNGDHKAPYEPDTTEVIESETPSEQTQTETVSVPDLIAESKLLGKNAAGEDVYQHPSRGHFRIRHDRKERGPHGYMDFGGDLAPVGAPEPSAADISKVSPEDFDAMLEEGERSATTLEGKYGFGTEPLTPGEWAMITRVLDRLDVRRGPRPDIVSRAQEAGLAGPNGELNVKELSKEQRKKLFVYVRDQLPKEQARHAAMAPALIDALTEGFTEQEKKAALRLVGADPEADRVQAEEQELLRLFYGEPKETDQQRKDQAEADRRRRGTENARKARQVSEEDDLITFARKLGGINVDKESDVRGRLKHLNDENRTIGLPGIEQTGDRGLTLDELAEAATEAGYLFPDSQGNVDSQALIDLLFEAESRKIYTPAGYEAEERRKAEEQYNEELANQANSWEEFIASGTTEDLDMNFSQVDPKTARLMALAGAFNHDMMVDIASRDAPEAEIQAALQAFIDERESAKTQAAPAAEAESEARPADEGESKTAYSPQPDWPWAALEHETGVVWGYGDTRAAAEEDVKGSLDGTSEDVWPQELDYVQFPPDTDLDYYDARNEEFYQDYMAGAMRRPGETVDQRKARIASGEKKPEKAPTKKQAADDKSLFLRIDNGPQGNGLGWIDHSGLFSSWKPFDRDGDKRKLWSDNRIFASIDRLVEAGYVERLSSGTGDVLRATQAGHNHFDTSKAKAGQTDFVGKTDEEQAQQALADEKARREAEIPTERPAEAQSGDDLFANAGQLEPDLFAQQEETAEEDRYQVGDEGWDSGFRVKILDIEKGERSDTYTVEYLEGPLKGQTDTTFRVEPGREYVIPPFDIDTTRGKIRITVGEGFGLGLGDDQLVDNYAIEMHGWGMRDSFTKKGEKELNFRSIAGHPVRAERAEQLRDPAWIKEQVLRAVSGVLWRSEYFGVHVDQGKYKDGRAVIIGRPLETMTQVLEASREPIEDSKPLNKIRLSYESDEQKVTHNAKWWLDHIDKRLEKIAKLRGCA